MKQEPPQLKVPFPFFYKGLFMKAPERVLLAEIADRRSAAADIERWIANKGGIVARCTLAGPLINKSTTRFARKPLQEHC